MVTASLRKRSFTVDTARDGRQALDRVRAHAPAVIVTDGYIEQLDPALVAQARATRLHVLVTREGSPAELARCGIPYTQLPALHGRHA